MMDVNYTNCGDLFTIYKNMIKSLHCMAAANIVLKVNYIAFFKKEKEKNQGCLLLI